MKLIMVKVREWGTIVCNQLRSCLAKCGTMIVIDMYDRSDYSFCQLVYVQ